ncbi:MAG TPA: FHA domain-containing protein [Pyrinomonadaceae bacterium]
MSFEIFLTFPDGPGNPIPVNSKRFTIGRDPENDLQIDDSVLSRRHAIIENFDGVIQISDCGSQNGTLVNGSAVSGSITLRDGDLITLGGASELQIGIREIGGFDAHSPAVNPERSPSGTVRREDNQQPRQPSAAAFAFTVPGIAILTGLIIVATALVLLAISNRNGANVQKHRNSAEEPDNINAGPQTDLTPTRTETPKDPSRSDNSTSVSIEQIESTAIQVMHRISSDDKTYSFSEKSLRDIEEKIRDYRTGSLPAVLSSLQRQSAGISAQARQQGMEPGLLIFMSLAESDGGRAGDPTVLARSLMSDLLALRATFGTNDADSCLIIVAAYRMGRGEKRSHPLLATMRRLVKNPLSQRNVWYLHDRGGLNQESYDFVIRFLALAVIAQDPGRFGIQSDPLLF